MTEQEALAGPYTVIADFFFTMGMDGAQEDLERWFQAAFSEEYSWSHGNPGNLLFIYEQIGALIEAAAAIASSSEDPSLTVLKAFFGFMDLEGWKETLYSWLNAGLSDHSIVGVAGPDTLLPVCRHLHRLVEACFVISLQKNVR
jgi:hypothetical protein